MKILRRELQTETNDRHRWLVDWMDGFRFEWSSIGNQLVWWRRCVSPNVYFILPHGNRTTPGIASISEQTRRFFPFSSVQRLIDTILRLRNAEVERISNNCPLWIRCISQREMPCVSRVACGDIANAVREQTLLSFVLCHFCLSRHIRRYCFRSLVSQFLFFLKLTEPDATNMTLWHRNSTTNFSLGRSPLPSPQLNHLLLVRIFTFLEK